MKINSRWKPLLLAETFLLLLTTQANGQEKWYISGLVLDSLTHAPLVYVLAYATLDSSETFHSYANTADKGEFKLQINSQHPAVWLHVRYLGYQHQKIRVSQSDDALLTIYLQQKDNMLKEVVVSEVRPPITQKSDTLTYDLKYFRDSTEFNVEDLLKKLPGIEVKSDGSVSVNGKAIDKVLVEGSDLFGRKYTLGTRNIRASFIDKVEVIDHYQENPVLKDINVSEAVVLNLLMQEDKKNILSGTFNVGGGAGIDGEAKGILHTNIFSISRRNKFIFLADFGNTGTQYGMSEISATYDTYNPKDIKASIHQAPDFQYLSDIQNPGLPSEFADNSTMFFSTLRSSHQINDRWTLNVNGIFSNKKGAQQLTNEQSSLLDNNIYHLSTHRTLNVKNRLYEGDAQVNYFSENQNRNFQSYFKWNSSLKDNHQDIAEVRSSSTKEYLTTETEIRRDWFFAGLFSQKTGKKSAAQLQLKAIQFAMPQKLQAENDDLPLFFGQAETFTRLAQSIQYEHRELEITGRYLWTHGPVLLEIEPIYSRSNSQFSNDVKLLSSSGEVILPFVGATNEDDVISDKLQINANLRGNIGKQTSIHFLLQAQDRKTKLIALKNTVFPALQTFSFRMAIQKNFANKAEGRITYAYRERNPLNDYYFSTPYFSDSYAFSMPGIQNKTSGGHHLSANYSQRDNFKFRSYFVNLRYDFGQSIWRGATGFESSLLTSIPFLSRNNNNFLISGTYDQFIPTFKTGLKLNASFSAGKGEYLILNEKSELSNRGLQLNTSVRSVLLRNINLILENNFAHFASYPTHARMNSNYSVFTWRSGFTVLYSIHDWRMSCSLNRTSDKSSSSSADLTGLQLRITKSFSLRQKPMTIDFMAVNLLNSRNYGRLQNDPYFFFRSSVQSVPLFFLIKLDFSI